MLEERLRIFVFFCTKKPPDIAVGRLSLILTEDLD
jgi:hypothetical protein